jgi:hypothetical protein
MMAGDGWGEWGYYSEERERAQDEAAGALDAEARTELARRVRIMERALRAMRALLAYPPTSPVGSEGKVACCWCGQEGWGWVNINHAGDCPWDEARAALGEEGER